MIVKLLLLSVTSSPPALLPPSLLLLLLSLPLSVSVSLSLSLSVSLSGLHLYELSPLKVARLIQILIMNGTELWLRYGHLCVCVGEREKVPDWWEVMTRSSALPSSITLSFRALWPSTFSLKL